MNNLTLLFSIYIGRFLEKIYNNFNISQTPNAYIHWLYTDVNICIFEYAEREGVGERREIFLC